MIQIEHADLEIQREPFARPFGFKGSAFHEKWNVVVKLIHADGTEAVGVGGLAVLWSDPDVFRTHTEVGGNILGTALAEYGLQLAKGRAYKSPIEMMDEIVPQVHEYGQAVTRNRDLKLTFSLISQVALDNAAWILYARETGAPDFVHVVPDPYRKHLELRQSRIAIVPAVGYTLPEDELRQMLDDGIYILKIKIGHPGDEDAMLRKDMETLSRIHEIADAYETENTESGKVLYTLDANARYGEKESMARLLEHARTAGFLERILLVEEPFQDGCQFDVSDLPACFAADESVHTIEDIQTRVQQGFRSVAIKPAGKTLSLSFQMVSAADEAGAAPFVADNACVPLLVDWNKNVAARLPLFPGMKTGFMESNGPQNYPDWNGLLKGHPCPGASWLRPRKGAFELDEKFYSLSGGIFLNPPRYASLFRNPPGN